MHARGSACSVGYWAGRKDREDEDALLTLLPCAFTPSLPHDRVLLSKVSTFASCMRLAYTQQTHMGLIILLTNMYLLTLRMNKYTKQTTTWSYNKCQNCCKIFMYKYCNRGHFYQLHSKIKGLLFIQYLFYVVLI